MPNNIIKAFAKKSTKKVSDIEKDWNKAKAIVSDEYPDIDPNSSKYYGLVVGTLKNMLDINEELDENLKLLVDTFLEKCGDKSKKIDEDLFKFLKDIDALITLETNTEIK
jgi:hypothetical protein